MRLLVAGIFLFVAAIVVGLGQGPARLLAGADALQGDDDGLQDVDLRGYLPEPPDGWTRRDWAKEDSNRLPGFAGVEEEILLASQFYGSNAPALHVKGPERTLRQIREQTMWIYDTGSGLIEVSIFKPNTAAEFGKDDPLAKGPPGLDINSAGSPGSTLRTVEHNKAYDVFQGVVWTERRWDTNPVISKDVPFKFGAEFGAFQLYARGSDVSEADMREMMERVDYDGLNALLATPVAHVGSAAVPMSDAQEQAYMKAVTEQQRDAKRAARRDARIQALETRIQDMKRLRELGLADQEVIEALEEQLRTLRNDPAVSQSGDVVQDSLQDIQTKMAAATEKLKRISGQGPSGPATEAVTAETDVAPTAETEPPQVRINRFNTRQQRRNKKSACGGVNFCGIGGN